MYCPDLFDKKNRTYIKPLSPRLKNTIFTMSKKELKNYVKNESQFIKDFIEEYNESRSLIEIYINLSNEPYTVSRRIKIKNWLDNHGAIFYSLNILKGYRWVKFIGKGSFSSAHLIEYYNDKKVVKVTINKKCNNNENLKLFEREMLILKSINHPYIIKLFDYGSIDNYFFWSLNDYCNLGSLDNLIDDLNYTIIPLRYRFIDQIVEALDYIHSKKIIHRDIKSANIFMCGEDLIDPRINFKLGDFNLSRIVQDENMSFCGSKNYMAPEIINKTLYNEKIDVWSFLCVLIELCIRKNINPILMTKLDLDEYIKDLTYFEISLINYMHKVNPLERPDTKEIKKFIIDNKPSIAMNRSRSIST